MEEKSQSVEKYPLIFEANHVFVQLRQGKFLIDTGSPLTFGKTPLGDLTYGTLHAKIPEHLMGGLVSLESLENLPGVSCDGLLGTDFLVRGGFTLFDGPNRTVEVGDFLEIDDNASYHPYQLIGGVPVLSDFVISGQPNRKCIFDTGAQYGYIMNESLLEGAPEDGEINDYNP
jgi:hypothetical protein